MTFRPDAVRGAPAEGRAMGTVDYRLARNAVLAQLRKGRLSRHEVCDAQTELVRAARNVGGPSAEPCPVCEGTELKLVSYVFGSRMPPQGRCLTSAAELAKLDRRASALACYVVEVCPDCRWNHLSRTFPVGGRAKPATT